MIIRRRGESRALSRDTAKHQVRGAPRSNILGTKEEMSKSYSATWRPAVPQLEFIPPIPPELLPTSSGRCQNQPDARVMQDALKSARGLPGNMVLHPSLKQLRQEDSRR